MKSICCLLLCLLALSSHAQKRAAIFRLDLNGNPHHLKPADIHIHVRQLIDRNQYLDSNGSLDQAKYAAAFAGKIDTNVSANMDYAFSLRNLNTGDVYRVSIFYKVPLDSIRNPEFHRLRATYQELKINSWAYEYRIAAAQPCRYDATLHNSLCPKCHKSDKVLPVLYGGGETEEESTAGPAFPAIKSYQSTEGATDCDPNWYCQRDRISF